MTYICWACSPKSKLPRYCKIPVSLHSIAVCTLIVTFHACIIWILIYFYDRVLELCVHTLQAVTGMLACLLRNRYGIHLIRAMSILCTQNSYKPNRRFVLANFFPVVESWASRTTISDVTGGWGYAWLARPGYTCWLICRVCEGCGKLRASDRCQLVQKWRWSL